MRLLCLNVHNRAVALTFVVALVFASMFFVTPQTNGGERPTQLNSAQSRDITPRGQKRKTVNVIFRVTSVMPNTEESLILIIGRKRIYQDHDYQSSAVRFRNMPCGVTARLRGVSRYNEIRWETRNSIPIKIPCNQVQFNGGRYYLDGHRQMIKRGWVLKGE